MFLAKSTKCVFYYWHKKNSTLGCGASNARDARRINKRLFHIRKLRGEKLYIHSGNFYEDLYRLIDSGFSLLHALQTLSSLQNKIKDKCFLEFIASELESGQKLSFALSKIPRTQFDCELIYIAEETGTLDCSLEKLASYHHKRDMRKAELISRLRYPATILITGCLITTLMGHILWPVILELHAQVSDFSTLPKWIRLASTLSKHTYLFIIFLLFGHVLVKPSRIMRSPINIPIISQIVKLVELERFTHIITTCISSGLSLSTAVKLTEEFEFGQRHKAKSQAILSSMDTGNSAYKSFSNTGVFSDSMLSILELGEQSGDFEMSFRQLNLYCQTKLNSSISRLLHLVQPICLIGLSVIIGGTLISLYYPILIIGETALDF